MGADSAATSLETWYAVQTFLIQEAELLDEGRLREWLDLLADDICYQIPIRITRERSAEIASGGLGYHMDEDKGMLTTRVDRLDTEFAWAEDPPSRTRRYVTNIRAVEEDDGTLTARSNLLLFRGRHGDSEDQLLAGVRRETLRPDGETFKIAKRVIELDHTTLGTHNLAIFL